MSHTVIQVDNVWKKYRLGVLGTGTLRHDLNRWLHRVRGKPDPYTKVGEGRPARANDQKPTNGSHKSDLSISKSRFSNVNLEQGLSDDEMLALRGVSFEANHGEILGVIGKNGAGKSTLLKILSRVTAPSSGEVRVKGRIASLLEVGTGFHPELTGRENIFLNGAILGMTKAEIKRKFDEIVAFSEVERYIDTPVKRYSSGMYVRLAFAVAAHLESEILIVDEVLAVGDSEFQKKCLGKMQSVSSSEGRTVLFVSHNLIAVQQLCSSAVLLTSGRVTFMGNVAECTSIYVNSRATLAASNGTFDLSRNSQNKTDGFRFLSISIMDTNGRNLPHLAVEQEFQVELKFELIRPHRQLIVGFSVHTSDEFPLFATHNNDFGQTYSMERGRYSVRMRFSPNYLRKGTYSISLGAISSGALVAHIPSAISLVVEPLLTEKVVHIDERIGSFFIPMEWSNPIKL